MSVFTFGKGRLGVAVPGVARRGSAGHGAAVLGAARQGMGSMTNKKPFEAEHYFGGLPTGPEVRKLQERFPNMESLIGTTIPHEDIEETIGVKRNESRYRTITNAWRKRVAKDTNGRVQMRGDLREYVGVGLRVLSDGEMVEYHTDLKQSMVRKGRKAYVVLANTEESNLTDEQKRIRSHGLHAMKMIQTAMIESRKFIPEPPKPPERKK